MLVVTLFSGQVLHGMEQAAAGTPTWSWAVAMSLAGDGTETSTSVKSVAMCQRASCACGRIYDTIRRNYSSPIHHEHTSFFLVQSTYFTPRPRYDLTYEEIEWWVIQIDAEVVVSPIVQFKVWATKYKGYTCAINHLSIQTRIGLAATLEFKVPNTWASKHWNWHWSCRISPSIRSLTMFRSTSPLNSLQMKGGEFTT